MKNEVCEHVVLTIESREFRKRGGRTGENEDLISLVRNEKQTRGESPQGLQRGDATFDDSTDTGVPTNL